VPPLVWGRDEAGVGDMWNSNSLIAFVLTRAGIDAQRLEPPQGGRAPGWQAGIDVALRRGRGGPKRRLRQTRTLRSGCARIALAGRRGSMGS
jgi:hypothetical protein